MRPLIRNRFVEETMPILRDNAKEPKPAQKQSKSPCTGFGLNSDANQREFAAKFDKLHKNWATLTTVKRIEQLQTLANEQLSKTGVPVMSLRSLPLNAGTDSCSGHSYGYFAADNWNMVLASEDVNVRNLKSADAGEMADTLYHESRHAEQSYLVARLEAANLQKSGMTTDQQIDAIAKKAEVKRSVAAQAQKNPLPNNAPEHACAEALDKELIQGNYSGLDLRIDRLAREDVFKRRQERMALLSQRG